MINPYNITNYNRTLNEKQEFLLFCMVVAGKTAYIQANKLEEFLKSILTRLNMSDNCNPFQIIKSAHQHGILLQELQKAKLGQYNKLFKGFKYIVDNQINLEQCKPDELEKIPGVGMKSSRFFLLHSNINYKNKIAILDTHILKFIKEYIDEKAPKSTPTIAKTYKYWEDRFLFWCDSMGKDTAEFDLEIWKSYARTAKS